MNAAKQQSLPENRGVLAFRDFVSLVKLNIRLYLPEEYRSAIIDLKKVEKLNSSYTGMTVYRCTDEIAACVNLEEAYADYLSDQDIDGAMQEISAVIRAEKPQVDVREIMEYGTARERLFIRLCGADHVPGADVPHHRIGGTLAMTYHVLVDCGGESLGSVLVSRELLQGYGIDAETLRRDALASSVRLLPVKICPLMELMEELQRKCMAENLPAQPQEGNERPVAGEIWAVTNRSGTFGASALFYPGVLEHLSEQLGGDLYILPSSVHEMLVLPAEGYNAETLAQMVREINDSMVEPQDRLSDEVYYYSAADRTFLQAQGK